MRKFFDFTKATFWIGLIFVLYMFAILTSETSKNYSLRAKSDELEVEIEQLQSQIEELGYKVTYYKTDAYKEKVARDKLGLQKPGESVVIVEKDQPNISISAKSSDEVPDVDAGKSHWQQWRDFLFGS